jgi:diaminopimelate decarboxylase
MLLELMDEVSKELNIKFEFFNISGGIGIPYHPEDAPFDMPAFVKDTKYLYNSLRRKTVTRRVCSWNADAT